MKKDNSRKNKANKINKRVVLYSLIGLGFLALMFFVDWLFVIGTVVCIYLNQKELRKKR